jgi:hypothetical protein
MLIATFKPFMLSVIMLDNIMLSAIMLDDAILSAINLSEYHANYHGPILNLTPHTHTPVSHSETWHLNNKL